MNNAIYEQQVNKPAVFALYAPVSPKALKSGGLCGNMILDKRKR